MQIFDGAKYLQMHFIEKFDGEILPWSPVLAVLLETFERENFD